MITAGSGSTAIPLLPGQELSDTDEGMPRRSRSGTSRRPSAVRGKESWGQHRQGPVPITGNRVREAKMGKRRLRPG
jgi:hypothetical protein